MNFFCCFILFVITFFFETEVQTVCLSKEDQPKQGHVHEKKEKENCHKTLTIVPPNESIYKLDISRYIHILIICLFVYLFIFSF